MRDIIYDLLLLRYKVGERSPEFRGTAGGGGGRAAATKRLFPADV